MPDRSAHVTNVTEQALRSDTSNVTSSRRGGRNPIQAKLNVGRADDPLEREADDVARSVVKSIEGPSTLLARTVGVDVDGVLRGCDGSASFGRIRSATPRSSAPDTDATLSAGRTPDADPIPTLGRIQRRTSLAQVGLEGGALDAETDAEIRREQGGGQSLSDDVRRAMESGFGADFSGVRVHADATADHLNRRIQSKAFTTGNDIFFGDGHYRPSSSAGKQLLAHELTHVVQQGGGLRRAHVSSNTISRAVVDIGGEKVDAVDTTEEAEAKALIKKILDDYGVTLSSPMAVTAIKAEYGEVPELEKAKLKTSVWEMKELRALAAALAHFAPILGGQRAKSSLGGRAQGVTTVGRVEEALDEDSPEGIVDDGTMGEYFSTNKTVGLFDTVTDLEDDRYIREGATAEDNATTLEANSIHEMAHGLIEPIELGNWVAALDFWTDENTPSGKAKAELPPTEYGQSAASEDLAESVAIFFVNRPSLKTTCPKREKFLADMVAGWSPPVVKAVVTASVNASGGSE